MVVRARLEAALTAEHGTCWQLVCTRNAALPLRKPRGEKRYRLRCCAALAEQHTPRVVIGPTNDGKEFDKEDALLQLDQGRPRFYVMRLPQRGLSFDRITYHSKVTQCLGAIQPAPWFLAVAAPSGSVEAWPQPADLRAFRIPHGSFVKLHAGTWHAGPLFAGSPHMDFFNLELADTNVTDHNTKVYSEDELRFEVLEA